MQQIKFVAPLLPLQQIKLQTTLADIASHFDCCLPTASQDWAVAHCDTGAGAKKPPPLAPRLCCHCPLVVICCFAVAAIIAIAANCCDAASWLLPIGFEVFPDAIAYCTATATATLLPLTLHMHVMLLLLLLVCCCCRLIVNLRIFLYFSWYGWCRHCAASLCWCRMLAFTTGWLLYDFKFLLTLSISHCTARCARDATAIAAC